VSHAARENTQKLFTQKLGKKSTSVHHRTALSGYIFATKARIGNRKKVIKQHSTSPHNMVNDDPLTAEIGSGVWGTPANFNEFRVLPSLLLHRRRATQVNHTLHDLWPSPGLVHYIYIFGGSCLLIGILSGCVQILR